MIALAERVDYKDDPNNRFGLGSNAGNPNRLKLVFAPGLTTNADRIEIFCNARESAAVANSWARRPLGAQLSLWTD